MTETIRAIFDLMLEAIRDLDSESLLDISSLVNDCYERGEITLYSVRILVPQINGAYRNIEWRRAILAEAGITEVNLR